MASINDTNVCNMALVELGANTITSLTDGSENAVRCNAIFGVTRDATLEAHDWSFARKRESLTKLAQAPVFEFDNAFQLPNDCLKPLYTDDDLSDGWPYRVPPSVQSVWVSLEHKRWQIEEGRRLLSDRESVDLIFTARQDSPDNWTRMFMETVVAHLAFRLAYPITRSIQAKRDWAAYYDELLAEAAGVDAQVGDDEGWVNEAITMER